MTELRQTALAGRAVRTLRIGKDGKPQLETLPPLDAVPKTERAPGAAGAPADRTGATAGAVVPPPPPPAAHG